jgi:hypothetical protein
MLTKAEASFISKNFLLSDAEISKILPNNLIGLSGLSEMV